MPGRKPRTSRVLILVAVLMCLAFGLAAPQSSSTPSPIEGQHMPDMFVAKDNDSDTDSAPQTDTSSKKELSSDSRTENTASDSETVPQHQVSPEAEKGTWTSIDGIWYFLVDGTPYRGWLYDTDGNTYYFNNKDGSMKTGWLKKDGKRYYFDLDGIMQTGDITVDGESYHLLPDGSQEGYVPEETPVPEKEKKESSGKKEEQKKESKKEADTKKTIALTFDDGPSSFTGRLLDCLEKNNAKATFFMVGKEIESFPEEVKRMEELGCELGNHTYSHTDLTTLSAEEISNEIGTVDKLLYDLTGHGATVVRPPYGSVDDNVRSTAGTPMVLWSVDTLDWETEDVQKIADSVLSSAEDGAVILMHDIFKTSVDAAEIVIPELIKEGYELVTVHELAEKHGITMEPGTAYGAM